MDITSFILGRATGSSGSNMHYVIVEQLPQIGEEGYIYLVPKSASKTNNYYDEYMYINSEWEIIGDTEIDLSNYQELMQYAVVPNATSSIVGKIIQYTGATTQSYTNGYFYQCVSDDNNPATYSWTNINVDNVSEDVNAVFVNDTDTQTVKTEKYQKIIDYFKDGKDCVIFYNKNNYYPNTVLLTLGTVNNNNGSGFITFNGNYVPTSTSYNNYGVHFKPYNNFELRLDFNNYNYTNNYISTGVGSYTLIMQTEILGINNTTQWTPTGDYNPATKKYVDDQVGSINTILATLTTPSNGGV